MTSKRKGKHPARPYGVTGGGFAEGQINPEQSEEEKQVGSFATGEDEPEKFPEDESIGSFAEGLEQPESLENMHEGTFGTVERLPEQ